MASNSATFAIQIAATPTKGPGSNGAIGSMRLCHNVISWALLLSAALLGPARAMEFELRAVASDSPASTKAQLIMSGRVEGNELRQLQDWVAKHPEIDTIVLKNSPGGDARTGYAVGEYLREKGLGTLLSGYCRSSCSRMFLGGKTRGFSDDQPLDNTYVAFHSNYANDGNLIRARLSTLKDWIIKYSDGKAAPQLVEQWIHLENRKGFAYFYHQQSNANTGPERVMLCQGSEEPQLRRELCAKPNFGDAMANGIVTNWDVVKIGKFVNGESK